MRILVLGGAGFVGRHAVAALLACGHSVIVGSRFPERAARRLPKQAHECERREVRFEQLLIAAAWQPVLAGVDVVLNCVGILRERAGETYDKVHHVAPVALADACQAAGVRRLVHVSALGLKERVTSRFLTSKRRGEIALLARPFDLVIVRPSLLDGEDGYGARWFRKVARWPIHAVPASARGLVAPLHVNHLGAALAALCDVEKCAGREVELGGAERMTISEYLARLRIEQCGPNVRPAMRVAIPHWIARLGSHICDLLHVTPYSFGHLQLMQHDNVPRNGAVRELLADYRSAVPRTAADHERAT